MIKRKFSKLEQMGGMAAVVVIGIFLYFKFFYAPIEKRYERLDKERVKISREVKDLEVRTKRGNIKKALARVKEKLADANKELEQAEARLAQGAEINEIPNAIIRTASETGLLVNEFNPVTKQRFKGSAKKKKKNVKNVYYSDRNYYNMKVQGEFSNLCVFLERLNNFPKLIVVERIEIKSTGMTKGIKTTLWLKI